MAVRSDRDLTKRDRARELRQSETHAEAHLWSALRDRKLGGWKWRRQVPVGPFFADFLCRDAGLIVELDGGQHTDNVIYDERRTRYLERQGFTVLRFWNSAALKNRDGVCHSILAACATTLPRPRDEVRGERDQG